LPVAEVRGRAWVASAAGLHVDLVETDTGRCLGGLPLEGGDRPDPQAALAVAPDGTMLAYCGSRTAAPGEDPKLAGRLLGWDLATAAVLGPVDVIRPHGRAITALDAWRVLLDSR